MYNIRTSNYSKNGTHPDAVSIAGKAPEWYKGKQYKELAPKWWFFQKYKEDNDALFYTCHYYSEVLDRLNPLSVVEEIGKNAILLCWESPGKFCHRRLVAQWLESKLDIKIPEV